MMMQMLWRRKEIARVPRAFGEMRRVCAKKRQPRRKQAMETRDFIQPFGCAAGWEEAPRARKIVFPRLELAVERNLGSWIGR